MRNYSTQYLNFDINNKIVLFKIYFQKLYPKEYKQFSSKLMFIDDLFVDSIFSNFAHYFSIIHLNMYVDFKNYVEFLCTSNKEVLNIEQELLKVGLSTQSLIDILYFIEGIVQNINLITKNKTCNIASNIKKSLRFLQRNFKHS